MWKNTDSKVLMEQKREYNNSFDLVKFWCSYIVISIHCGLRNDITPPTDRPKTSVFDFSTFSL